MIIRDTTNISLKTKIQKILCFSTARNATYLCLRVDTPGRKETILHLDSSGHALWEYSYNNPVNSFSMMNDKEFLVMNLRQQKIDIISLETHQKIQVHHKFAFKQWASMWIETFADTKYFCVVEKGDEKMFQLELTYFCYEGINESTNPIAKLSVSKNKSPPSSFTVKKANNSSKIVWFREIHAREIEFQCYSLNNGQIGKQTLIRIPNNIGATYGIYGLGAIPMIIFGLWEINQNKYLVQASSQKYRFKDNCLNQHRVYNDNYIVDASSSHTTNIREASFDFGEYGGFHPNNQLIDCFGVGSYSVFHSFRHEPNRVLEAPVYFVDNSTETLLDKASWKCTSSSSHFFFPGWDSQTYIQSRYQSSDCQQIEVSVVKRIDAREMYLHFLLVLNEDFDDDLLQDAVESLQ